ncbi:MAG: calcium-binding protein [Planktomarina sp.]
MSRIFDSETDQPTTNLLFETPFEFDVIIEDFFASPTDDSPAILARFKYDYDHDPDYDGFDLSDALSDPGNSGLGEVYLPVNDILSFNQPDGPGHSEDDNLSGTNGDDHLEGFDGDDRIFGKGGDDRIEGDRGDDRLFGMSGDDVLFGGAGNNRIDGGTGDDKLVAVGSQDEVWGDAGSDVIFAGADETTVWFEEIGDDAGISETDTIHNFDIGQDKIMIEGQAFDATSAAAFLAGNAQIDGEDLFIDLGDGRAIKIVDIVEDDDDTADGFVGIFGDLVI